MLSCLGSGEGGGGRTLEARERCIEGEVSGRAAAELGPPRRPPRLPPRCIAPVPGLVPPRSVPWLVDPRSVPWLVPPRSVPWLVLPWLVLTRGGVLRCEAEAEVEAAAEAACRSPASQIISPASQIMRGLFERLPFSRLAVGVRVRVRVTSLQQACAAPNP